MREVFISYKSNDPALGNNDETVANELCAAIEAAGISCWIAPRDIEPGARSYEGAIMRAIKECSVMLLVFSRFTNDSDDVFKEVANAARKKKQIIPFCIDDSEPNDDFEYHLGSVHWVNARGDYKKKISELIVALNQRLGKQLSTAPSANQVNTVTGKDELAGSYACQPTEQAHQSPSVPASWPSAEDVEVDFDLGETRKEEKQRTMTDRILGAAKDALYGGLLFGPAGMVMGGVVGAARSHHDSESEKEEQNNPEVETLNVNGVMFRMIRIDGGSFTMGDPKKTAKKHADIMAGRELPVFLSTYYLSETPVTQELWEAVTKSNPSFYKGDVRRPVENVSWIDCQRFIKRLNELTGRRFRLPTEEEWEFAARGGINSKGYKFAGSNNLDEVGWYYDNSDDTTHPVKMKKPNELGLYDMSGNVWEWCKNGMRGDSRKIYRGGCYLYGSDDCTVFCRNELRNTDNFITGGLRLVLECSPADNP